MSEEATNQTTVQDTAQTSEAAGSPIAGTEQETTATQTPDLSAISEAINAYRGDSPTSGPDDGDPAAAEQVAQSSANVLDGVDAGLLEAGRRMAGLDDDGIKAMLTANKAAGMKVLETARAAQHRIASEFGRQNKPDAETTEPAKAPGKVNRESVRKKLESVTSDEATAAALMEAFDELVTPLESKLAGIDKSNAEQRQALMDEQLAQVAERVLPSLPRGEALYGKGGIESVSAEHKAVRVAVFTKARQLFLGAQHTGEPVSWESALADAHKIKKDEMTAQAEQQRTVHDARAQQSRMSVKPVSGRASPGVTNAPDPMSEIRRSVRGFLGR